MLEMASVDSQCVAIGDSLFQRDGDSDEGRATTGLDRPERTDSRSLPVLQPFGCLAIRTRARWTSNRRRLALAVSEKRGPQPSSFIGNHKQTGGQPQEYHWCRDTVGSTFQVVGRRFEWIANISNPRTRRAYQNAIRDFLRFTGIARSEEFRTVTRARIVAWRDAIDRDRPKSPPSARGSRDATLTDYKNSCIQKL
jgi:hypothetical protein